MDSDRPRDSSQCGSGSQEASVQGSVIVSQKQDHDGGNNGSGAGQHVQQGHMQPNPYNLPPVNTFVRQTYPPSHYPNPYAGHQPANGQVTAYPYGSTPQNHPHYQQVRNPYGQSYAQQALPVRTESQYQPEHRSTPNASPRLNEHHPQHPPYLNTNTHAQPSPSHVQSQETMGHRSENCLSQSFRPAVPAATEAAPDQTNVNLMSETKFGHAQTGGAISASSLHWNSDHTMNDRHMYCYCGEDRNLLDVDVQCEKCLNFFHGRCIRLDLGPVVPFMTNYRFNCKNCSASNIETFSRTSASWKNVCASVIANLILIRIRTQHFDWDKPKYAARNSAQLAQDLGWYSRKSDIVPFLDVPRHWASICSDKDKFEATTWPSTLGNALVANPEVFRSADEVTRSANSNYTLCNLNLFSFKAGYLTGMKAQGPRKRKAEELEVSTATSKINGNNASSGITKALDASKDESVYIPPERTSARERAPVKNDDVPAFTAKIPTVKKEPSKPTVVATKELARERKPTAKKAAVVKKTDSPQLKLIRRPPPYKPQDFGAIPKAPGMTQVEGHFVDGPYYSITDIPYNKRGFKYTLCEAAPSMPATMYREVEVAPFEARIDWSDMSPYMYLTKDGKCATTDKGFRMGRANVGVREGQWYWEAKVLRGNGDQGGHVRLGVARREASLDGPLGFDGYSYGIRDKGGEKMHLSRPRPFMEAFGTGDVIGFHLSLPKCPQTEIVRDRIPIRYRQQLYFEQYEYTASKEMEDLLHPGGSTTKASTPAMLKGSFLKVYKNGKSMGTAFEDLFSFWPPHCQTQRDQPAQDDSGAGYYPAISVYSGGAVQLNFGPCFDAPPEDDLLSSSSKDAGIVRPISQRYEEHIAEDMVQDLIDEIDFEQDLKGLSLGEQEVEVEPIREIAEYD